MNSSANLACSSLFNKKVNEYSGDFVIILTKESIVYIIIRVVKQGNPLSDALANLHILRCATEVSFQEEGDRAEALFIFSKTFGYKSQLFIWDTTTDRNSQLSLIREYQNIGKLLSKMEVETGRRLIHTGLE